MTKTSQMLEDLPLAAATLDSELATYSGGKVRVVRDPDSATNESQKELLSDVFAIHKQVEAQGGVIPATLLNMHPWPIRATGIHNEGLVIPPCPIADEYIQFVQRTYRRDYADRWGNFKVQPIWPIMIVRDFQQQHAHWGGIVIYMGDEAPGAVQKKRSGSVDKLFSIMEKLGEKVDPEMRKEVQSLIREQRSELEIGRLSDAEKLEHIKNANEIRIAYYEKRFDEAEQAVTMDAKNGYRKITFMDRMIAQWLFHRRRIKALPPWITEKKPKDFLATNCGKCGSEVSMEKGFACVKCNAIYHGIRAYEFGEITADNVALKRHTREELDAAGLTHVKTLAEDRAEAESKAKKPKA